MLIAGKKPMLLFMSYFWEASYVWRSLMAQQLNPPMPDSGAADSISGSGRTPGEGNGNPPQYSHLKNPMDRGTWWATVIGVTKIQTWLSMRLVYEGQHIEWTVEFMSLKVWEPVRTGDINLGLIKASGELKFTEKRRIFIILWCEKSLNAL